MRQEKYFYTILFLDDYDPNRVDEYTKAFYQNKIEAPKTLVFKITNSTNTRDIWWSNEGEYKKLHIRHTLPLPLTLEMWNDDNQPIFYCPILKKEIDSISVGQIVIESDRQISILFDENTPPPQNGETFKLAIKTLPSFDTNLAEIFDEGNELKDIGLALDQIVDIPKIGRAIVFRRNSLDSLFDLLADFDDSYWHSLAEGRDLNYLTQKSFFHDCSFACKYTSNLQDVLDLIDTSKYDVTFSWESRKRR